MPQFIQICRVVRELAHAAEQAEIFSMTKV
jgi:hypothetical protein